MDKNTTTETKMSESFAANYLNFASTEEIITRLLFVAKYLGAARRNDHFVHSPVFDERRSLIHALSRRV